MSSELELRLEGASSPAGEIRLADLAALAQSLQDLSLRVGRAFVDAEGPGRTPRAIEDLSQLRLRRIDGGSTRLTLALGPADVLDVEVTEAVELDRMFWEVIYGVGKDQRPEWVTGLVADSAAAFVSALQSAAPTVEVTMSPYEPVRIRTREIHRETWTSERQVADQESVVVTGLLEKVDLHSHAFRIRDDVGNTIELTQVPHDRAVATLIGSHITAMGHGVRNRSGRLTLEAPVIGSEQHPVHASRVPSAIPLSEILDASPGPSPAGAVELTDEEYAAFLEAIGS